MYSSEIRTIFSNTVSALLVQGMTLYPDTMSGTQGEIAHIDLTDGSEIYRVLLTDESNWGEIPGFYGRKVVLTVGKACKSDFYCPIDAALDNYHRTVWNNKLEVVSRLEWFQIGEKGRGWYTDKSGAIAQGAKAKARFKASVIHSVTELDEHWKAAALKYIRKQYGFKSCKLSDFEHLFRTVETHHDGTVHRRYDAEIKGKRLTIKF